SAYSIAINHYHLKFYLKNGLDLAKVKQLMHGGTSFLYKKEYNLKHNDLWQSSHVLIITSEEMNIKIAAYVGGNLIKHKEVNTFQELENNQFSSYKYFKKRQGNRIAQELVRSVIDLGENKESRIDAKELEKLKLPRPSAKAG
ncbi:MAG: hypothetical protein HQ538_01695, partial [Parcubacteria group bacterium]|nr:hypothetical protein [Parcubacteria group bacterium]